MKEINMSEKYKEIEKRVQKKYDEFRLRMMRDGEVFIDRKGNFIEPENINPDIFIFKDKIDADKFIKDNIVSSSLQNQFKTIFKDEV